jgi:hypothetical protein
MNEMERCRPWIEDALQYCGGTHNFEDVADAVNRGDMQLWPADRGCLVTSIVVYPRRTLLHIFLAGGELDQLKEMQPAVIEWAKAQGCDGGTINGRLGWVRALRDMGWIARFAYLYIEV